MLPPEPQAPPWLRAYYDACVTIGHDEDEHGRPVSGRQVDHRELQARGAPHDTVVQGYREGWLYWGPDAQQPPRVATRLRPHPPPPPALKLLDEPRHAFLTARYLADITQAREWQASGKACGPVSAPTDVLTHAVMVSKVEYVQTDTALYEPQDKHRRCGDASRSGVNDAMPPTTVAFPTHDDAIRLCRPFGFMARIDQAAAFHTHLIHFSHRAAVTMRDPTFEFYYTAPYMIFGVKPGSEHQQATGNWFCTARARGYGATPVHFDRSQPDAAGVSPPRDPPCRCWICMTDDYFTGGWQDVDAFIDELSHMLGLHINIGTLIKSKKIVVGLVVPFLGKEIDCIRMRLSVTPPKVARICMLIAALLQGYRSAGYTTLGEAMKVLGCMAYASSETDLRFWLIECFQDLWPLELYGPWTSWTVPGDPCVSSSANSKSKHRWIPLHYRPVPYSHRRDPAEHITWSQQSIDNFERWARELPTYHSRNIHLHRALPGIWRGQSVDDVVTANERARHTIFTSEGIPDLAGDASFRNGAMTVGREAIHVYGPTSNILPAEAAVALFNPVLHEPLIFDTVEGFRAGKLVAPDEDRRCRVWTDNKPLKHSHDSGISRNPLTQGWLREGALAHRRAHLEVALDHCLTHLMRADAHTRPPKGQPVEAPTELKPFTECQRLTLSAWRQLQQRIGWEPVFEAYAHAGNARTPMWCSLQRPFNVNDATRDCLWINGLFSDLESPVAILEAASLLRRVAFLMPHAPSNVTRADLERRLTHLGFSPTTQWRAGEAIFEAPPRILFYSDLNRDTTPGRHIALPPLPWPVTVWCH